MASLERDEVLPAPANDGSAEPKRSYCGLWPFFSEHTLAQAGGSHWAPPLVMAAFRFIAALGCISWGIVLGAVPAYSVYGFDFVFVAMLITMGVSFLILALCSVFHAKEKESVPFAKLILFLHTQAILFAVILVEFALLHVFDGVRAFNVKFLVAVILPIGLYTVDILVFQSRMVLRVVYQIFFDIVLILKTALWSLYAPKVFSSFEIIDRTLAVQFGIHLDILIGFTLTIVITHAWEPASEQFSRIFHEF